MMSVSSLRPFSPLFLALLGACNASTPKEQPPLARAEASEHDAPPATSAARESAGPVPEAERLGADVRWLADDARAGRRAGTPGEQEATDWIAARLGELGLEPLGTEGFLQPFTVPLPARDAGGSSVVLATAAEEELWFDSENVVPLFCSAGAEVQGPFIFGGYGIVAPELGWDDYGSRNVKGAIVVIARGTPPEERIVAKPAESDPDAQAAQENPHGAAPASVGGWGGHGSLFLKVMEAKRRGAAAVLVAPHPDDPEELLAFDSGSGAEVDIPTLMISHGVAKYIVAEFPERILELDRGEQIPRKQEVPNYGSVSADVVRESGTARNVLARIPGKQRDRTVVVGAHLDHLGLGGPGSLDRKATGQIHNGADDNASGTAAVLEIARCLRGQELEGDVILALWSGEELGLLGSEHWARNPTVDLGTVRACLNLDMVGRADDGKLDVLGAGTAAPFAGWLAEAGPAATLELTVNASGQGIGGSDHQTFHKRKIPALHFFSGLHSDYHRPSDDAERFEAEGAARTASLVIALVKDIQSAPELAWVEPPPGKTPGAAAFRTRFGSIPDYAWSGEGYKIDGTSAGGPAEHAGLLRGDVIVAIDDVEVGGIEDFMYVLETHKPGDVLLVKFQRDGQEQTTRVTLESNQVE